ncbi:MAG: serine protease [archaeon]
MEQKLSRREALEGLVVLGLSGLGLVSLGKTIIGSGRSKQLIISPNSSDVHYGKSPINSSQIIYSPNTILINGDMAMSPPHTQEQSVEALSQVFSLPQECTQEQSVQNIFENIVRVNLLNEVQIDGSQRRVEGTGQRITTDGWVLTAYHVIKEFLPRLKDIASTAPSRDFYEWSQKVAENFYVEGSDKIKYAIDPSVVAFNTSFDIALIKTYSNERAHPITFLTKTKPPVKGEKTEIYVYEGNNFVRSFGQADLEDQIVESEAGRFYDCFRTTSKSSPGYSGSPVINPDTGEYIGMDLAGDNYTKYATCAKARNLVSLVRETVQKLK